MAGAYYNEVDPFAANWLEQLIARGLIAPGVVDRRDIRDVAPDDLAPFTQHHFFAGIGGWSYAARLAGWPDDEPLATGSCPCQPFSATGRNLGFADERHLWPALHYLIQQRRFPVWCGEQVARRAGLAWFDLVRADMDATGYAGGALNLPASCVGAPHRRERMWLAYALRERLEGHPRDGEGATEWGPGAAGSTYESGGAGIGWRDARWLPFRDGCWRPVEPGSFPLAYGIPGRVGRVRGYGNAIVPQLGAEFLKAVRASL